MDFLSNLSKTNNEQNHPVNHDTDKPNNDQQHLKPTKSDVIHSAKVVADAAQSHIRHEPEKYDKAEVASATADLLNAASEYGKLEGDKGLGKYVDKAEGYLRHYGTSHSSDHADNAGHHKTTGGESKPSEGQHGGGSGDLMKMAGDFLKK